MQRSIKRLLGYTLKETDGKIGEVEEFYFDDQGWTIRYLIVKTGNWLSGKKVLISPTLIRQAYWEQNEFPLSLTQQEQIENSAEIDKSFSSQQVEQLSVYSTLDGYWGNGPAPCGGIFEIMPDELYKSGDIQPQNKSKNNFKNDDKHLRGTEEIMGYNTYVTDGQIGKVFDYIFDDTTWKIKFLVIDTGTWMAGRKVLLDTKRIQEVNWDNSEVILNISIEEVKNSPEITYTFPWKKSGIFKYEII